jgi:hypothetical protein
MTEKSPHVKTASPYLRDIRLAFAGDPEDPESQEKLFFTFGNVGKACEKRAQEISNQNPDVSASLTNINVFIHKLVEVGTNVSDQELAANFRELISQTRATIRSNGNLEINRNLSLEGVVSILTEILENLETYIKSDNELLSKEQVEAPNFRTTAAVVKAKERFDEPEHPGHSEDVVLTIERVGLIAVMDGMGGGGANSAKAAQIMSGSIEHFFKDASGKLSEFDVRKRVKLAVEAAAKQIKQLQREPGNNRHTDTTLSISNRD